MEVVRKYSYSCVCFTSGLGPGSSLLYSIFIFSSMQTPSLQFFYGAKILLLMSSTDLKVNLSYVCLIIDSTT